MRQDSMRSLLSEGIARLHGVQTLFGTFWHCNWLYREAMVVGMAANPSHELVMHALSSNND
jgi:hypothetical protein